MKTHQIEEKLSAMKSFNEELIAENGCPQLYVMINELMKKRNISRSDLIFRLNMQENYGYQLLNGTRIPTRDCLIKMGLLLETDIEHLQRLLKTAGRKSLYVRDMFDAKVYYAVQHKMKYEDAVLFIWGHSDNKDK